MTPRTPQQPAYATLVALRTAPLAALYFWQAVPLDAHDEVCGYLGDVALKRIIELENANSGCATSDLRESLRSVRPEASHVGIEDVLRRELATIERRPTPRLIHGNG